MLQLDDGARLIALPGERPLFWRTGVGLLEISPERLTLTTPLSSAQAQEMVSPRPFRLRLTDGTLYVGWPQSIAHSRDAVVLAPEAPDLPPVHLTLVDVMEINDLPRSGPAARIPLPLRAGQTQPAASPTPAPEARRSSEPVRPPRRRPMSSGGRAAQLGVGYCGMLLGGLVGAMALTTQRRNLDKSLVGLLVGAPLGASLGIYATGSYNDGRGSFLATLLGAAIGSAISGVILANSGDPAVFIVPFPPLIGGMIGYLATDE